MNNGYCVTSQKCISSQVVDKMHIVSKNIAYNRTLFLNNDETVHRFAVRGNFWRERERERERETKSMTQKASYEKRDLR